jgi:hypothetical protein
MIMMMMLVVVVVAMVALGDLIDTSHLIMIN